MSIAPSPSRPPKADEVEMLPPLVAGQRLDQPTFHARYQAMPPHVRAELIDGVVSMPSPLSREHCRASVFPLTWLDRFAEHTRGVELLDGATVILGGRNEVQPDATLRVLPECGGQTRDEKGYVAGAPELVVEVSRSSRYVDLGPKFDEYERAGMLEYVVRSVEPDEVLWFAQQEGRFLRVAPDADGLYRSRAFPGLWLDPAALLANDRAGVRVALDRGLASPEHAAFVARLAAARQEGEART
ncbi:MAG: Uma2 family endonuclease [Isosphaeraceae bacterium]